MLEAARGRLGLRVCRASYIGEPIRRKVKDFSIAKDRPFIEVTDYENAYLWDGKPMEQTSWH